MSQDLLAGICIGFIIGFLVCLALVHIIALSEAKKIVEGKKAQLAERMISEEEEIHA
jgi:hypothetical protein